VQNFVLIFNTPVAFDVSWLLNGGNYRRPNIFTLSNDHRASIWFKHFPTL